MFLMIYFDKTQYCLFLNCNVSESVKVLFYFVLLYKHNLSRSSVKKKHSGLYYYIYYLKSSNIHTNHEIDSSLCMSPLTRIASSKPTKIHADILLNQQKHNY